MTKSIRNRRSSIRSYPSKYPCHVSPALSDSEWRKQRTLELYSYLPQTSLEERAKYTDIRDEVIFINYSYFGFIANNVYLKSCSVSYEDKFQAAVEHFCTMWHKFMFAKKYRTDLSFSVFFKPRLSECVYRELLTVKYTVSRSLKIEAAEQIGKHYTKLTYEDLSKVRMPPEKLAALKSVFFADCEEDLDTACMFVGSTNPDMGSFEEVMYSDEYDDIEHMLINEMVEKESTLDMSDLYTLSDVTGVSVSELQRTKPKAEKLLYDMLTSASECRKIFT